jgi:DNA-binding transcriptional MerR regulator
MSGWIKLHRKFLDWEWFNKSEAVHLFLYMLIKANHKDGKWQGVDVKRGQFISSLGNISNATGLSIQVIRTNLKRLEKTSEILVKSTSQFTIVTICKYECYQQENEEHNKQLTNEQQTINKQLTTNKNEKNNKEINMYYFDKFWTLYGKSTDKQKCLDKFVKLTEDEIKTIFETLPVYLLQTPDKKYRKNPLTYLNGKCWNDIDINNPQVLDNPFNLPPVIVD